MGGQSHAVSMYFQLFPQRNEGLNISTGTNHLNDNIQMHLEMFPIFHRDAFPLVLFLDILSIGRQGSMRHMLEKAGDTVLALVDLDIQAPITYSART